MDLPQCHLNPLSREDSRYWGRSRRSFTAIGASWSDFNWSRRRIASITSRLQMSDQVIFPEAAIKLNELVEFLLDRGARLCIEGSAPLLRNRLETAVGTPLMEVGKERDVPVLTVAKPGETHNSLSLSLKWVNHFPIKGRNSLPFNFIVFTPQESGSGHVPGNPSQSLVFKLSFDSLEAVFQVKTSSHNLDICDLSKISLSLASCGKEYWPWLATAVVGVFGFSEKATTTFRPRLDMLRLAHGGCIRLGWIKYGLRDLWKKSCLPLKT